MKNGVINKNLDIVGIYKKLDTELMKLSPGCDACGACCHFDTFGHELYASTIEVNYILRNVKMPPFDTEKRICPFLVNKKCTIRKYRTLGCRVFYCNPQYRDVSQEIYNKYYKMVKDIAIKNQIEWHYAPMMKLLTPQITERGTVITKKI